MEEQIGVCCICGKGVYCRNGFFDGDIGENHELYCFACADEGM